MRDALRNAPGVSLAAGEGGQQGDNLPIRGFNAQNDFFLDDVRDFGSYYRDPFNLQSIEVIEGPASVLFGRGSTGGSVNQVSKQPQIAPVTQGSISFGTDGTKRITTDVNRAIDGVPGAAIRLNLMGDLNGTAGRDGAETGASALHLNWHLVSGPTRALRSTTTISRPTTRPITVFPG